MIMNTHFKNRNLEPFKIENEFLAKICAPGKEKRNMTKRH